MIEYGSCHADTSGSLSTCGMPARFPVHSIPSPSSSVLPPAPLPSPPPRRRRRRRRLDLSTSPSRILLGFIATLAVSASSVDGRPLSPSKSQSPASFYISTNRVDAGSDPDFAIHPSDWSARSSQRYPRQQRSASIPTGTDEDVYNIGRTHPSRRGIPDRYVEGDDGRWRKMTTFDVSGCAVCSLSTDK